MTGGDDPGSGDRRGDAGGGGEVGADPACGGLRQPDQEAALVVGVGGGFEDAGDEEPAGGVEGGGLGKAGGDGEAGLVDVAALQPSGVELQH